MDNKKNWYIFSCFWKHDKQDLFFVYGYAIQTYKRADIKEHIKIEKLLSNQKVFVFHEVISDLEFSRRFSSTMGHLDFSSLGAKDIPIFCRKIIIQKRLGHYTNSYLLSTVKTLEDLYKRLGKSDTFISQLLQLLSDETELDFTNKENYGRLGCFEHIIANKWLDNIPPVQINIINNKGILELRRSSSFSKNKQLLHLILRNHGDIVLDKIYIIPENDKIYKLFDNTIFFSNIEYWLFSNDGKKTIQYEKIQLTSELNINMSMITGTKEIQDSLTKKAQGKDISLGEKARKVETSSIASKNSMMSASATSWLDSRFFIESKVRRFFITPREDKWFSQGIEDELLVIEYICSLIDKRKSKKAILMDPFFGYDALERFVLRISSDDADLTVLTSLGEENPDNKLEKLSNPEEKLHKILKSLDRTIIRNLKIINLRTKKNHQAFHDRYLCIYDYEGNAKVYLLSNSLNKASGNWPFCMSILAPDVGHRVREYLEELCNMNDIENNQQLKITYQWPEK